MWRCGGELFVARFGLVAGFEEDGEEVVVEAEDSR